ncbi:M15 family metallopeptidase [Halobacillus rhizosphaerae]|uniref:M15 family metallopeptidase n=1 Tax=Halobacillus rhizosphaerae TaxID=3064889 RepID=UPI00398B753C
MRYLPNIAGVALLITGLVLLLLFVVPRIEPQFPDSINEKEQTPMPTMLHPVVQEKKEELIDRSSKQGISIVITDGYRSKEEQDKLYEKGRTSKGSVVTNVRGGGSYHNYGLAIDFALKQKNGNIVWDMQRDGNHNGKADWMEVVSIAKDLGFEWGGDWASFKDYPHLQMDFGLTIRELKNGNRPKVNNLAEK